MTTTPELKTLLVGFGKIGQGYSKDPVMKSVMQYRTHAEVLKCHDRFNWVGVVDKDPEVLELAVGDWQVPYVSTDIRSFERRDEVDVAVLAIPPHSRYEAVEQLPNLKAIIVEKPLGLDFASAERFAKLCVDRKIHVQVNFLRRCDPVTRELALNRSESLGKVHCGLGIYSNGLLNNGSHVVDLARMFLGEPVSVEADTGFPSYKESPIEEDLNIPAVLTFQSGPFYLQAVPLSCYRENGIDLWCEKGRLSYLNSGFSIKQFGLKNSNLVQNECELDLENPIAHKPGLGKAFYNLYSNLADTVCGRSELFSTAEEALKTSRIMDALIQSYRTERRVVLGR